MHVSCHVVKLQLLVSTAKLQLYRSVQALPCSCELIVKMRGAQNAESRNGVDDAVCRRRVDCWASLR